MAWRKSPKELFQVSPVYGFMRRQEKLQATTVCDGDEEKEPFDVTELREHGKGIHTYMLF